MDLPGDRAPLSTNLDMLRMFDKGEHDGSFGPRHLVILAWRLLGELDLALFQDAIDDVVARHEMLRTQIVRDDGEPYQKVFPPSSPELVVIDLPPDETRPREEQADDFVNEIEATTMSVAQLPHLRVVLGRIDERDAVCVLVTHHVASDGVSLQVIIRDLATFYATRKGFPVEPPTPARQYREFTAWQRKALASPQAEQSRTYWREAMRDAELVDLPTDHLPRAGDPARYAVYRFGLDHETTSATTAFATAMRSSPFMVMTAAFNALLHQETGTDDLVSAIITSGRVEPDYNETVGPFFNMLPLRTELGDCRNFMELVRRTREACLAAYTHELPFAQIAAQAPALTKTYERPGTAVWAFQVMQYPGVTEAELIGDVEYTAIRKRHKSYPVTSDIPNGVLWGLDIPPTGEIAGTARFNTNEYDQDTVIRMVEQFRRILRAGVQDPASPLSAL
ncbi:condensation domain-containing protein [Streptomyces sp. NBC_01754]|uniref:condensation domain-containing protein n=1 Tax=Streptomyces sp. NBC_01754 TaxID=2975930 RepID=UPI002DD99D91|nr:condensation domain-containing protein [Streptomyces sp. NBC_01754]WSC90932.1 condensation domain-containing protein [Streptomyces sp. NBC_01754]WSC96574.1 condensation domain-containing protein [Streptomyces sp. NBC_01754]